MKIEGCGDCAGADYPDGGGCTFHEAQQAHLEGRCKPEWHCFLCPPFPHWSPEQNMAALKARWGLTDHQVDNFWPRLRRDGSEF